MSSAGKFSALNTKIKAMTPGLVSEKNYQDLQKLETERAIAKYLHDHTRFKSVFKSYNIENLKRWEIELIILKEIIVDFNKLGNFLNGKYSSLVDALLFRYEVRDLKLVVRSICRNELTPELGEHMMHDRRKEHVNFDKLIQMTNITELASFMRGTIYEEAFYNIEDLEIEKIEFHLDMVLDALYFKKMMQVAEKLDKEDREIGLYGIALMIDLLNLQWIYRAKNYHQLLDEELINYTLLGGNLGFKKLKKIIYSEDANRELKVAAGKMGYQLEEKDDEYMQIDMQRFFLKSLEKQARKKPMSIAPFFYFVNRIEYETNDIISIVEGVRYGILDIEKLLVRGGN